MADAQQQLARLNELGREALAKGMKPDEAKAYAVATYRRESSAAPPQEPGPSGGEAVARGAAQGVTLGYADEAAGAVHAAPTLPQRVVSAIRQGPFGESRVLDEYREGRDAYRAKDDAAQDAHPVGFGVGEVGAGLAAMLIPGAGQGNAVRAIGTTALGAASALGHSKADLTKGESADKDMAIGGGVGLLTVGAGSLVGAGASAVGKKALDWGRARLFKAAVGQNKRAFTQMDGKGMLDKAGEYLDDLGVGLGDSTESIAEKVTKRSESLRASLDDMVQSLDGAMGGGARVSSSAVADRIEKNVAAPLKKLAAHQAEYRQVMDEVANVRALGKDLSFSEAAAQRRAVQEQINYDIKNGRNVAAEARKEIAQAWNEVIDEKAEPLLVAGGKAGDAYKELRRESNMVLELSRHIYDRVKGNASNRFVSPSDYGMGATGAMAGMFHSPGAGAALGLVAAVANHLGRVYGNAAAGRAAINMARAASVSPKAMRVLFPAAGRASTPTRVRATVYAEDDKPGDLPDDLAHAVGAR